MTVFTVAQADHLDTVETQVIGFYQRMLATGADPEIVAGALAIEIAGQPGLGQSQTLHECSGPGCHSLTDTPVRDTYAAFWIGEQADTYCSDDCLTNAAEQAMEDYQSQRGLDALCARQGVSW